MSKYSQSRAVILQPVGIIPENGLREAGGPNITERDYAAVPPPLNLQVHPVGNCLIWLWRLNAGGYGIASFPGQERLAHRQAFVQSRRRLPNLNVLHLCHRPFCVQPSHLYDGSAKDNSEDRQVRTSQDFRMELFSAKSEVVQAVAKYRWTSPARASQEPLLIAPAQHDCAFIVPAMDRLICPTCGRDNLSGDADGYFAGAAQPDDNDLTLPAYQGVPVLLGTSPEASSSNPTLPRITQFPSLGPNAGAATRQFASPRSVTVPFSSVRPESSSSPETRLTSTSTCKAFQSRAPGYSS